MSRTLFIEYAGDGFWAYDVATGVFLKHLIDRANRYLEKHPAAWLSESVTRWRINAVVSDYRVQFDSSCFEDQRQVLQTLIEEACGELGASTYISADEAASWRILDGQGIDTRGATQIATAPVVELGQAILALLAGTLPKAPSGHWWFYGTENGISTIQKRA